MIQKTLLIAVGLFALNIAGQAQAPSGTVYIESNIGHVPGQNSILAFSRNAAGHLTSIGEFLTGGTGVHPIDVTVPNLGNTLGPFDSDQNVILNAGATLLFAVNSGSDSIAVFDVHRDGTLTAVKGSPFPSDGTNPVSLGLSPRGDILTVVNKDYDLTRPGFNPSNRAPNYSSFRVNPNGKLIQIPFGTIQAAPGGGIGPGNTTPSQALVPNGKLVFDADTFGTTIHSFSVQPNGRLERVLSQGTPASEHAPIPPFDVLLPNPAGRPFVLGLAAHPSAPVFYAGFIVEGRVAVYMYDAAGIFTFVKSVPAGLGICWVEINASGNRIYTSNTLINAISVLDTTDPFNPVKLQDFPLPGPPAGPVQLAVDPRGEYLFVVSQKTLVVMPPDANQLHVLRLAADGTIVAPTDRIVIPTSPSLPQGIAVR